MLLLLVLVASLPLSEARGQEGSAAGSETSGASQEQDVWAGIEELVVVGVSSSLVGELSADSVIGFDSEDLVAIGADDISDLAAFTPNLEIVTSGATTPTFFIRGIGLNDFSPNSTGAVAIYQDDVAINAPAIQLGALFDTEAVNVFRGPQGTGQGRNASAGAIKLYARKPSGNFGGYMRADYGNYNAMDYEGAIEMPIFSDILAARFSFRLTQRDGTMTNRCADAPPFGSRVRNPVAARRSIAPFSHCGEPVAASGGISPIRTGLEKDLNDNDVWAARGVFRFEPNPDASFLLKVQGSRRDEYSRVGQSIGTQGTLCDPGTFCVGPRRGAPDEIFDTSPSQGLLGGTQGPIPADVNSGYIPREIRARINQLAPCILAVPGTSDVRCTALGFDGRIAANDARIQIGKELARDLDFDPWSGDFNRDGKTTNDVFGSSLKAEFEFPHDIELDTTTGVDRYRRQIDIDLDFSPETLFHTITQDDAYQVYQDFTLSGLAFDESSFPVEWEVGGFGLREQLDARVNNDFSANAAAAFAGVRERIYEQNTWSAGAFAFASFSPLDDFTIDGGFRYNWEQKEFDMVITGGAVAGRQFAIRETWDSPSGTIRVLYNFNEEISAFWKFTRGWKPGTINATASAFTGPTVAEPEELDAFEMGVHGVWFDGNLTLDASYFSYDYTNYQVFTSQQFFGGNVEFVILNAESAEVNGIEVDASGKAWEGSFGQIRFAWLETQFNDFTRVDQFLRSGGGQGDPFIIREQQNSGNPLLNSPRFKISLTAQQEFPLGKLGSLTFRYDGTWTDRTSFDQTDGRGIGNDLGELFLPEDTIGQDSYWLHNLRLTWRSVEERLEAAFWVRNLENTAYKTFAFDASNFQNTTIFFVGDPRTYGASFMVKFF